MPPAPRPEAPRWQLRWVVPGIALLSLLLAVSLGHLALSSPAAQARVLFALSLLAIACGALAVFVNLGLLRPQATLAAASERELQALRAQLDLAMQRGDLAGWEWRAGRGFRMGSAWRALFKEPGDVEVEFDPARRIHPADLARVQASFAAYLAGQSDRHHVEFRLLDGAGNWRQVVEDARVIERDAARHPLHALGIHKDITRSTQIETELLARTEFLELATRGSMDGIWDWDIAGDHLYSSPRLGELLGYPPGGLPSVPAAFIAQVQDPAEFGSAAALLALNEPGAAYLKRDFRLRLYDGSWRWFDIRAAVVRDDAGQIVRMVGSMSDIEERRQREAELAEARQMLQESIEALDSGLLRLDAQDRIVFCNSRYREMYEHPPEQVLEGMLFRDVVRWGFEHHQNELRGRSIDEAVEQRMALHRTRIGSWEIHLASVGRWVLASDRPTRDGGVVSLRTEITAQKLTELTLKDRTELLELAMRGSEAGIWDWQADGPGLRCSERFWELLGFEKPLGEVSPRDFIARFCHPDEHKGLLRGLCVAAVDRRRGDVFGKELRLLCANLSWRWFNVRAAVIRDARGRVVRVAGSLVDANARKVREQELADARQHLHDAVESLDAGLAMYDAAGRLLFCNERFQALFAPPGLRMRPGLTTAETLATHFAANPEPSVDGAGGGQHRRWLDLLNPAVGTRDVALGERWFHIADFPTQAGGVVSLRTETTAIRRAEQALRTSEATLRTVSEGLPLGIFLIDAHGHVGYANRALCQILGVASPPETRGQWVALIHPDERRRAGERIEAYLTAPDGNLRLDVRLAATDGQARQVYLQVQPVMEAGRAHGFAATLEDVTERRRQEAEQRQLHAQLQQAQKMEAIGQLTGGVAHDFNNILASVLGYATLATMRPQVSADPKLAEYLAAVVTAGERARDLVAKMLAFSRSRPAEAPAIVAVPTLPLLNEVVALLRSLIPASHQLVTDFDSELPPLLIDGVDLHQAVINLAINARDAIEAQGRIIISARAPRRITGQCASCRALLNDDYVEIAVRDSGQGIPAERLPRIFEPFFTTKEVGKGTGMGLAVTHGVVHAAGGHVQVESQPGQGTCVRILLPAHGASLPPRVTAPVPSVAPSPRTAQRTILVVDDEPAVAEMWREVFTTQGYAVQTFADPATALAFAFGPQAACDLVLTDQSMPGMTGLEFAREFLARRPTVPVILCTGLDRGVDAQLASAVGVSLTHVKPVPIQVMLDSVHKLLTGAGHSSD